MLHGRKIECSKLFKMVGKKPIKKVKENLKTWKGEVRPPTVKGAYLPFVTGRETAARIRKETL